MQEVRVRFAPSPTGALHIGGARTALFNWLFARSHKGAFILRIEDTDIQRSNDNSARGIIEGLRWLGLDWDEGPDIGGLYGPYLQSERLSIYQKYLQKLLEEGNAYYCFCSTQELKQNKESLSSGGFNGYPGTCRNLCKEDISLRLAAGQRPVIRLKVPAHGTTVVHDLIRGDVEFKNALYDDFIIAKSDGWPTYNFAVVIDDYTMRISHVIRAEEHLSNTPKQILIYETLGMESPQFAHVSMILAPDRSKLSKRHGATSVQEFRDEGFLPQAILNYLALLGWSPGDDLDLLDMEDILARFSLDQVSHSPAIYDVEKLTWMNGHYLNQIDIIHLVAMLADAARKKGWLSTENESYFTQVVDLVRSRAKTLNGIFDVMEYFFSDVNVYDEKGVNKYFSKDNSSELLQLALNIAARVEPFQANVLEEEFRRQAQLGGIKVGDIIHPSRLSLTGRTASPGIFEVMEILGRSTCLARLTRAIDYIKTNPLFS